MSRTLCVQGPMWPEFLQFLTGPMCPSFYVSQCLSGQEFVARILCVHGSMCLWPYVSRPNVSSPLCVQGSMWPSTYKIKRFTCCCLKQSQQTGTRLNYYYVTASYLYFLFLLSIFVKVQQQPQTQQQNNHNFSWVETK